MANLLVFMEVHEGTVVSSCLHALELGRIIASRVGASLYTVLAIDDINEGNQSLIYQVSAFKSDKLIIASTPGQEATGLRLDNVRNVLNNILKKFPPAIMLFGNTPASREIAAFVASSIRALFIQDGTLFFEEDYRLEIRDPLYSRKVEYTDDDIEQPVVGIICGEPETVPEAVSDIEVIVETALSVPNEAKLSGNFNNFNSSLLVVIGSREKARAEFYSDYSLENEIPVARLFGNHLEDFHGIPHYFYTGLHMKAARFVFIGLTKSEVKSIIPTVSRKCRCLFLKSQIDMELPIDEWGQYSGDEASLLQKLAEEV